MIDGLKPYPAMKESGVPWLGEVPEHWEVTTKWTYYYLYNILDVFSRYSVGWMIAERESAALAEELIAATCVRQDIQPGQLTIHGDRGSSMTSKPVALLMADLGVTKTHSRPHVSNDNPFSESQFKTLKYRPDYPERFGCQPDARSWTTDFFQWYNFEHHHSALGLLTPADLHFGRAQAILDQRQQVLQAAYVKNPQRFVKGPSLPAQVPPAVWINPPRYSLQDQVLENDPNRAVQTLLASIGKTSDAVQKSILKALVAKKLYEYLNMYRWRFYNRKATVNYAKADINTWGIADFHKAITQYFLEALADKEILLHTSLKDFEAILIKGDKHRSSLYHLLANEALVYFKSGDPYSTDPLYVSRISDPVALSGREVFIKHPFLAKDNSMLELIALQLYQHLLTVTTNADELVGTDIGRIEWVYSHAQFNNKESVYRSALETIISNNKQVSSTAKAWVDRGKCRRRRWRCYAGPPWWNRTCDGRSHSF